MDHMISSITAIASSIIGLAIITVLVRQSSNTSKVIQSSASGFAQVLGVAMGAGGGIGQYSSPISSY